MKEPIDKNKRIHEGAAWMCITDSAMPLDHALEPDHLQMKTQKHGMTRRSFLQATALSTGTLSFGGLTPLRALGANDRIRVGVIGVGGMGSGHLNSLVKRKEADSIEVPEVCYVYRNLVNGAKPVRNGD